MTGWARGERIAACITFFAMAGWMGCGGKSAAGSGGPPAGTFATSVDGGALTGLTTGQATQLCAEINNAGADGGLEATFCNDFNLAFAVNWVWSYVQHNPGTSTAMLQSMCESYLQGEQSGACTPVAGCDVSLFGNQPAACVATVSDVVACINEYAMLGAKLANSGPSCASVSATTLSRYYADGGAFDKYNVNPASCAPLLNCNGFRP
jgi:hypothetical protein